MVFLLDLFLLGILAYSIWNGYKKGMIKAMVRFGLMFASILGARWAAAAATPVLSEKLPLPGVGTKLASFLNIQLPKAGNSELGELLTEWGFPRRAAQSIERLWEESAASASDSISRQLTPVLDRFLTEILVFLFFLLVFWLIAGLLAGLLDGALEVPLINKTNRLIGLGAGALSGLLLLWAIGLVMSWAAPLLDASFDLSLTEGLVQKSFFLRMLSSSNPLGWLLG
jgi:uncharacterized membrane protein required for colicin V production